MRRPARPALRAVLLDADGVLQRRSGLVRGLHMRDALRLDDHFDAAYYSFEQGVAKPDPAFFIRILDDLGEPPGAVLFVDDLPGNVRAARALGIDARLHLWRSGATGLRRILASRL